MKKVLNKISNDEIVALYFGNGDKFFCGKITAIDEEFFVLRSYTPTAPTMVTWLKRLAS